MEGIAIALAACVGVALICRRYAIPPIPFYIITGLALGTAGFGIVQTSEVSEWIAHMGLLFLLFTMGLHLHPGEVAKRRGSFLIAGMIDLCVNFAAGLAVAFLIGLPLFDALVLAGAFYISSSAIALSSLIDNRKLGFRESDTVIWLMVFEDIMLVALLILFTAQDVSPLRTIGIIVCVAAAAFVCVGKFRAPLREFFAREDELPILAVFLAVVLAVAVSDVTGVPDSLFVIILGSAISLAAADRAEVVARPFREVFLVVFFVFFGISVSFTGMPPLVILASVIVLALITKLISGLMIGKAIHGRVLSGIDIWADTTSRGEFSILLALLYGSSAVVPVVAAMVVITSCIGSFTGKYSVRMRRWCGCITTGK
ncbi:cation:proton antiporter [Methanogenium sp. S4BF]|uniref:cation:proton antiporter n=1 Tax=Methanogenium sp. S4BF TaxID=1789226 RepID=UPI002416F01E|nr:cation:proton antiporter [Methanogenium sp. S4BF]WFN34398.1 cation:proton antiporter [Methanogenium sp. S4BF]